MGLGLRSVEGVVTGVGLSHLFGGAYEGRRVLVTGHTGFKGSWLTQWLRMLGAEVTGYALEPATDPALWDLLALEGTTDSVIADVRDGARLAAVMTGARPEIVFHLAAQPLVRLSYDEPHLTYETNVMGTVNVLEAVRATPGVRAVVNVTSDKCYENREIDHAYREDEPMGGYDPYSSSKGCAELVASAYRRSYFGASEGPRLASVRAGNVIGGGDWALDRIVPDCVRALAAGEPIVVRNPGAVRPWQHVLEPLSGYLWLGARLLGGEEGFDAAWNFGPTPEGHLNVRQVVESIIAAWGSGSWQGPPAGTLQPHEAHFLKLDSTRAIETLGWRPAWESAETLARTARWYRDWYSGEGDASALTRADIAAYVEAARAAGALWVTDGEQS